MNIIEVKNLSYAIGTKKILDNVNATFTAGKITTIIRAVPIGILTACFGAPIFMQIINRRYKDS